MAPTPKVAASVTLLLLLASSAVNLSVAEKLSLLLPGQDTAIDIDHHQHVDGRSSSGVGLSLPLPPGGGISTPTSPQLVLDAPPATVPTSPPGINGGLRFDTGVSLQSSRPALNALYEVPEEQSEQQTIAACQAQTFFVTLRETVTSTRLSQIVVPTTVFQERVLTSTDIRYQTDYQTNYVTIQSPPQTRVETRVVTSQVVRSQTVFRTTTAVRQQYITTTQVQFSTQVVTRPVREEVTVTSLRTQVVSVPVTNFRTVVRTEVITSRVVEPNYVTVTSTQYQPNTCQNTGYTYQEPTANYGSHYGSNNGGYYLVAGGGGAGGHGYGHGHRRPVRYGSRNKGLFGKWFK